MYLVKFSFFSLSYFSSYCSYWRCSFLYILRDPELLYPSNPQCKQPHFFLLLTYWVCLYHPLGVKHYASSSVSLFHGLCIWIFLSFILVRIQSILQGIQLLFLWLGFYRKLISWSFLFLLRNFFLKFHSIFVCLMVSASNIPRYLKFL